ncbi:protein kinase 2b chloroplastic [Phtheirospermum japonicum]|uniref:Protein kinase 2b chloroplastic n=1 Tax=Phtheirospermum japonicum TaxID=374723 RepID=A0A830CBE0_9LAMI|nr:protein kinase 2b chloroplastic [Phtheirospermum japonicum]
MDDWMSSPSKFLSSLPACNIPLMNSKSSSFKDFVQPGEEGGSGLDLRRRVVVGGGGEREVALAVDYDLHRSTASPLAVEITEISCQGCMIIGRDWLPPYSTEKSLGKLRFPTASTAIFQLISANISVLLLPKKMRLGWMDEHSFTASKPGFGIPVAVKILTRDLEGLQGSEEDDGLEFNAKLAHFNLALDSPTGDMTYVTTRVMGTYSYVAPEYMATGHLTAKYDVYSFGVFLLELLSGRRVIDKNRGPKEENLADWAESYLREEKNIFQIMDCRLEGHYPDNKAYAVATIALHCLSAEPKERPQMAESACTLERFAWGSELRML